MTISKLNIVRDCWWAITSGTDFLTDENFQQSTLNHGLYKSLNANDSEYIQFHGTGYGPSYMARLETNNIVPEKIVLNVRGSGDGSTWGNFFVNSNMRVIGSFGYLGSLDTQQYIFDLNSAHQAYILQGRANANYDYVIVQLVNSGDLVNAKIMDLEVYYSGVQTWDTYTAGLPNVLSVNCYPNKLKFRSDSQWINQNDAIVDASGYYHINMSPSGAGTDDTYIEQYQYSDLNSFSIYRDRPTVTPRMPNGGLSLIFDVDDLEPLTQITRARMTLRMSLPPSGLYDNIRDSFEINGYNARYKEQDYKNEMLDAVGSIKPLSSSRGYFIYGAGPIVEQSGFKNYTVELDFINSASVTPVASTYNRNIDIFNTMEFQLVGLPSGTQLSAAQLYLEYLPNNTVGLYTAGGTALVRHWRESYIDNGGFRSPLFGDGKWQHRGNLNEGETFDAFYTFSEQSGLYTYPISLNEASGTYGEYVNAIYEDPIYEDGELTDIIYTVVPVEPTRKNIYRNPVRTEFGTTYDPTHYRDMIYNASPFTEWDIHDPDATVYSSGVAQVYFDDRVVLDTDFTLYFSLYREPTNQGQSFAQFFSRGHLGSASATEYEIQGFLEPEKISIAIKDTNDIVHTASLDLPAYNLEPILVWVTCKYENGITTLTLNVHDNIKAYFYEDWMRDEISFNFPRKQYADSKTMLGPLYTPSTLDQQLAFSSFFSWVSIVEFGWADSAIDLEYNVTNEDVQANYDISTDIEKRFLASRLTTNDYLMGGVYTTYSIGGDSVPPSTGWIDPNMTYSWGNGAEWRIVEGSMTENDAFHSLCTPTYGYVPDAGAPGDWLFGTFDFNVPSGYIPTGLEFRIAAACSAQNGIATNRLQLGYVLGDGSFSTVGTRQESSGPIYWSYGDFQYYTYGGPVNTWGLGSGLTGDFLNDPNLAVGLRVSNVNTSYDTIGNIVYNLANAYVDVMQVRVWYSGQLGTIEDFKHINWLVAPGSGAASCNTSYLIDNWRHEEHSIFNPITTAGTHNIVHPSAIYVEIETEHSTNHPSGVKILCDLEFDTGTTDNWKVFRSEFTIPSSTLITSIQNFSKHINMDEGPIVHSDVSQLNLTLRTSYADIGSQTYHGDLKVRSIKVHFDSYTASVTGLNYMDLYTTGTYSRPTDSLDLFIQGVGIPRENLDLYIYGCPYGSGGTIPLYIKAEPFAMMPLYIEGLTPNDKNNDFPLYTWATPAGVGGLYKSVSLIVRGVGSDQFLPLYLYNNTVLDYHNAMPLYLQSDPVPTGMLNLFMLGPSGHNETTYLYIRGLGTTDGAIPYNNNMDLYIARDSEATASNLPLFMAQTNSIDTLNIFIEGVGIPTSSISMYTSGSGDPINRTMKLYTNGFS